MAINTINTKLKLVNWVYRKLGADTIQIELSDNTIEANIEDALLEFSEYSSDVTYQTAYVLQLSAGIDEYDMPEGTQNITGFDSSTSSGGVHTLFSPMNMLYEQGAFNDLIWSSGYDSGIVTYELGMEWLELSRNRLNVSFDLEYNKWTNKLTVVPNPTQDVFGVITIYTQYDPGTGTSNIYGERWVKEYALALSKISLGYIWGKYENMALPDGSNLNYTQMINDGKEEKEKLEEELITRESEPLGFFVE